MSVTWQQPDPANGMIRQYNVTYYPSGSPSDNTTVSTSSTSITIGGLSAFTEYSVFVVAVTMAPGPASTTVTVTTSEAGMCVCTCSCACMCVRVREILTYTHHLSLHPHLSLSLLTHLAAPAAPREVTATNLSSTEISVTWQQPDPANGIIQQYIVTYYPSGSPSDNTTVPTSNTSITIGGLSAFTNYSVFVVAVTVAPGPASTTVTVMTSEAGAYMCVCVCVCCGGGWPAKLIYH